MPVISQSTKPVDGTSVPPLLTVWKVEREDGEFFIRLWASHAGIGPAESTCVEKDWASKVAGWEWPTTVKVKVANRNVARIRGIWELQDHTPCCLGSIVRGMCWLSSEVLYYYVAHHATVDSGTKTCYLKSRTGTLLLFYLILQGLRFSKSSSKMLCWRWRCWYALQLHNQL